MELENTSWMSKAACIDHDTEVFYPESGDTKAAKKAITICKSCSVRDECLYHALTSPESFGVWGGFTYRARLKIARSMGTTITLEKARKAINER